ncbi:MAG: hypothetical protein ACYCYP_09355 [Leptospirales bacterium]
MNPPIPPEATPNWIEWIKILGGGSIGGFLFSFFADFIKIKVYRPTIEVNFPIEEKTNLEDPRNTPFLVFIPLSDIRKFKIVVRAKVENLSKSFSADRCRVFLTKIEQRISGKEEWKQTDYNEINQVAWSEKSFDFEEVDIFPENQRSFDFLEIETSPRITIRTIEPHPSFSYLFPFPIPQYREWRLHFQIAGENFKPTPFMVTIIACWEEKVKGNPEWKVLVNGCNIDFNLIFRRNPIEGTFT